MTLGLFPTRWREEPASLLANLRLALLCLHASWAGCTAAIGGSALIPVLPGLLVWPPVVEVRVPLLLGLWGLAIWRLSVAARALLQLVPEPRPALARLLPASHAAAGIAAGAVLASRLSPDAPLLLGLIVLQGGALPLPAMLRRLMSAAQRYAPGNAERVAARHGLQGSGNRPSELSIRALRGLAVVGRLVVIGSYSVWAIPALLGCRLVRLAREPHSFECDEALCHLPFDDPELGCRCGNAGFRSFPGLRRPVLAVCPACGRAVPTARPVRRLLLQDGARLAFSYCRQACREHGGRRARVIIVPIDAPTAARFMENVQHPEITMTLAPTQPVGWCGDADAVLVAARSGAPREDDARFALDRLALPRADATWGDVEVSPRRGPLWRLLLTRGRNRDPLAGPYGRRRMPVLALLGPPGTAAIPRWIAPERRALERLLEQSR